MSFEPDALWRLRSPRLFEGLAPQDLRALAPLLDVRRHRRGDVVFYTGEKADRVFFLDEGAVKISATSPEGKERILDLLTPGHIFGELFVGADGRRTAAAETLSPVTLRTIAEGALMDLLHTLPRLGLNFVRHLVHQHRRAHFRLAAMLHMKPGPRLLAILVDLAEHCGEREGDDYALPGSLTHGDLALMAGLHRTTVSLLISDYRRKGIIAGQRRRLVIHHTSAGALLQKAGSLDSIVSDVVDTTLRRPRRV